MVDLECVNCGHVSESLILVLEHELVCPGDPSDFTLWGTG